MRKLLLLSAMALVGCTATVSQQIDGALEIAMPAAMVAERDALSQSGSVFLAKFSTVGALNSQRTFVSDYHGEIRFTVYPNEKIDCRFWAEGRVTDKTVYEGINGFIEAYSTLCTGRLQRDNTFEIRGAYILEGPGSTAASGELADEAEETFTLNGKYQADAITGNLVIGSVFRNAVTITDSDEILDLGEGVAYEAVLLQ